MEKMFIICLFSFIFKTFLKSHCHVKMFLLKEQNLLTVMTIQLFSAATSMTYSTPF